MAEINFYISHFWNLLVIFFIDFNFNYSFKIKIKKIFDLNQKYS